MKSHLIKSLNPRHTRNRLHTWLPWQPGAGLTWDGEHTLLGRNVHGVSYFLGLFFMGKQHDSSQSSSHPQSHSSPISTTPLPQMAFCGSVKQPLESRALELRTLLICRSEHGENLLLFCLSPDVAL